LRRLVLVYHVEAPAKLTIRFQVRSRRSDGYHLIEAEMVALSLVDLIKVDTAVSIGGVTMVADPLLGDADRYRVVVDASNSVVRALDFLGMTAQVEVKKRIPQGAGLGGGSSDAAAILRALGYQGDPSAAAVLGADVPPSFVGGHVCASGIGDKVEILPDLRRDYVLFFPEFSVSTIAVYRAFDRVGSDGGDNDLFLAACEVEPRLRVLASELRARFQKPVMLAGSGSTLFVEATFVELGLVSQRTSWEAEAEMLTTSVGSVVVVGCHTLERPGPNERG
jgi:4-diphosphocytidyl-2-C-methyl-D-erythritol kinase